MPCFLNGLIKFSPLLQNLKTLKICLLPLIKGVYLYYNSPMALPFLLEQLSGGSSGWGRESCGSGKLGPLKEGEGMLLDSKCLWCLA